jgi:hypothetical protein
MIKRKIVLPWLAVLLIGVLSLSHLSAENKDDGKTTHADGKKASATFSPPAAVQYSLLQLVQGVTPLCLRPGLQAPQLQLNPGEFPFKPLKLNLHRRKKGLTRAALESFGHLAYATVSYWIRKDVMKEDWEYQFTWKDQKKRFLFIDGMRFDSNTFQFNWTHSLAGSVYYNYARANRLNRLESFVFSFATSYVWEFVVEFREVVSINDMIATPVGGLSIGEAMFHTGRFFRSQKPTLFNKLWRLLLNPVQSLNSLLDGKKRRGQFTFNEDYWHDCRFFIGPRVDRNPGYGSNASLNMGVENKLFLLPEFGMPGVSSEYVPHTAVTELDVEGAFNLKGLYEFDIFTKAVFFGYFSRNIRSASAGPGDEDSAGTGHRLPVMDETDDRVGYSLFLGVASGFNAVRKFIGTLPDSAAPGEGDVFGLPDNEDKYVVINLLGPSADLVLFHKDLTVRLTADAYGDFSLIHSYAFKDFRQRFEPGTGKCTLDNHGYYYALGLTFSSMLQVNYANLEFRGKVKYHYFDSIEGLDRFQKDMPEGNDFDLTDSRLIYNLSLGYRIPNTSLQLVLGMEHMERGGTLRDFDFTRGGTEKRSYFQLKYLF